MDPRRAGVVVYVLFLLALAGSAAGLFVAGAASNGRADQLRNHGVTVEATVTSCLGQLGGSGSNAAGYTCRGRFRLAGVTHDEVLPGNQRRSPGDRLALVADPGDPGDLATPSALAALHPGAGAYALPSFLAGLAALLAAVGALRYRRSGRRRRGAGGV